MIFCPHISLIWEEGKIYLYSINNMAKEQKTPLNLIYLADVACRKLIKGIRIGLC